jgi:hypothetical protein
MSSIMYTVVRRVRRVVGRNRRRHATIVEGLATLDEGQRALGIATGWLRAKMASAGPVPGTRLPIDSRLAVRRSSGL